MSEFMPVSLFACILNIIIINPKDLNNQLGVQKVQHHPLMNYKRNLIRKPLDYLDNQVILGLKIINYKNGVVDYCLPPFNHHPQRLFG
jgi:hypothetical protein